MRRMYYQRERIPMKRYQYPGCTDRADSEEKG